MKRRGMWATKVVAVAALEAGGKVEEMEPARGVAPRILLVDAAGLYRGRMTVGTWRAVVAHFTEERFTRARASDVSHAYTLKPAEAR